MSGRVNGSIKLVFGPADEKAIGGEKEGEPCGEYSELHSDHPRVHRNSDPCSKTNPDRELFQGDSPREVGVET